MTEKMNGLKEIKKKKIFSRKEALKSYKKFVKKNKLHAAEEILLRLIHHGYGDSHVQFLLASTYDRLAYLTGDDDFEDRAMNIYDEIIRYGKSWRYRRKAKKSMNILAERISRLNQVELKAVEKAREFASSNFTSPKAWFVLGANFSIRKDPFFVLNAYKNAVKLAPNYIAALFRVAYIYQHNLRDYDSALSYYLRLIKVDPVDSDFDSSGENIKMILEAYNEMSQIYLRKKEFGKVISVLDRALPVYRSYIDQVNQGFIKTILFNAIKASDKINKTNAMKSHFIEKQGIDLDSLLIELRI